jgi:hypothetical protein
LAAFERLLATFGDADFAVSDVSFVGVGDAFGVGVAEAFDFGVAAAFDFGVAAVFDGIVADTSDVAAGDDFAGVVAAGAFGGVVAAGDAFDGVRNDAFVLGFVDGEALGAGVFFAIALFMLIPLL